MYRAGRVLFAKCARGMKDPTGDGEGRKYRAKGPVLDSLRTWLGSRCVHYLLLYE